MGLNQANLEKSKQINSLMGAAGFILPDKDFSSGS